MISHHNLEDIMWCGRVTSPFFNIVTDPMTVSFVQNPNLIEVLKYKIVRAIY